MRGLTWSWSWPSWERPTMVSAPSAAGSPQSLAMSATDSGWPMASPRCCRSFFSSAPVTASPLQIDLCEVRHIPDQAWGLYAAY